MKSTATANPVLTGLMTRFMQNPRGRIGLSLFPLFLSGLQSAQYYVWDEKNGYDFAKNLQRAPGSRYSRSIMTLSDDSYNCKEYGHEEAVDDRERKKYSLAFNADQAAVRRITDTVLYNHELRVKTAATGGTVPTATPATKWDAANSDPIADIDTAKWNIWKNTGLTANLITIPKDVFKVLKEHVKITAKIQYVERAIVTEELLRAVFGVDRVIIADQLENTANEGAAAVLSNIWGDGVMVAYVDPAAASDLQTPSFGRTFGWTGEVGPEGVIVESYREDAARSDVHRGRHDVDEKLNVPKAGYYISDTLVGI